MRENLEKNKNKMIQIKFCYIFYRITINSFKKEKKKSKRVANTNTKHIKSDLIIEYQEYFLKVEVFFTSFLLLLLFF